MNKFEQLIEYVINDEEAKARELFHEIVVEKSRAIYEEMMEEEEDEENTDDKEPVEEGFDEDPALGGDQSDDLIRGVEAEEDGQISMEDEEEEVDGEFIAAEPEAGEEGAEEENIEDRVVDLEDKLDQLMAEFESLMGDEAGEEVADEFGDEPMDDMGPVATDDDELETEGMFENVTLKTVAKPSNTEEASNKKSVVAANSGARGALAKPVHTGASEGGHHDSSAYKNNVKDMIGKVGNSPSQSTQQPKPATKPNLGQASGVNTKSVIQ